MKNHPKVTHAWCMYDWANSVYSLVITSSIFPVYYASTAINSSGGDVITFLGFSLKNTVWYSYSLSFTFLFIACISPLLSSIADNAGRKKAFMQFFSTLGALACIGLYFFTTHTVEWGIVFFVLAGIGFSGSIVFYNSYLPEIATPDKFDRLSAKGYALGYIGSVLLLIFNLSMLMLPELYGGISSGMACRISFLSVGLWWLGFAQYTFWHLPKDNPQKNLQANWLLNGYKKLRTVAAEIAEIPSLRNYLIGFFLYNMGVQTVMYVAVIFAEKELSLPSANLIATVLLLQLVAIIGAMTFARLSEKIGNIYTLFVLILVWVGICTGAYFVNTDIQFYLLASFVGLVMGGVQSMSRSTYSKLIPAQSTQNASFFSFYDVAEKLSTVVGTFIYGLVEQLTGSARNSILFLLIFFLVSLIPIRKVSKIR